MGNKTIYVSKTDEPVFEEAKSIAGKALSTVISQALKEFVARNQEKEKNMNEVSLKVGPHNFEREIKFIASLLGSWQGFSDDKQLFLKSNIYFTKKGNWAIHVITLYKTSLLLDKEEWKKSGDYLLNPRQAELIVTKTIEELKNKIPKELFLKVKSLGEKDEKPVEFLDI